MTKRRRYAILLAATCVAGVAASQLGAHGADVSSDALIHADASRALGYTGTGVTVAVIDTGIDDHNPELANAVVAEHCFVPPDGCPDGTAEQDGPGSAQDDQGHGTAIADIIAGKGVTGPVGIVPDASLVVVKVADRNGRTSAAQIVAGLNWVRTQHPEAKVVNVSLGSDLMLSGDCTGLTASLTAYGAAIDALHAQGGRPAPRRRCSSRSRADARRAARAAREHRRADHRPPQRLHEGARIDLAAALGALLGQAAPLPPAPTDAAGPAAPIFSKPTVAEASLSTRPISFGAVLLGGSATRTLVVRNTDPPARAAPRASPSARSAPASATGSFGWRPTIRLRAL